MVDEHMLEVARELAFLNEQRYQLVKPEAKKILRLKLKDPKQIEKTLDTLLDVLCFQDNEEALTLYRRLCRHYFNIDPQAAFDYVDLYREQCDPDEDRPYFSPLKSEEEYDDEEDDDE